jgi:hypothetical protein
LTLPSISLRFELGAKIRTRANWEEVEGAACDVIVRNYVKLGGRYNSPVPEVNIGLGFNLRCMVVASLDRTPTP